MKIALIVSYDGTDFCGWQKQKQHAHASPLPNIQETIEMALEAIFQQPIDLCASGRTDAGVHAVQQVCHFEVDKPLPKDLCWALKAKLPPSIVAKKAWVVPGDFHATLSATRKTYKYWIWNSSRGSALLARYSWWLRLPLDEAHLNKMAQELVGHHDFASFRSMGTPVQHCRRHIYSAQWIRKNNELLEFRITGSGFLKQMVRNIVGTHIDLCFKKLSDEEAAQQMRAMLEARDRTKAGRAAPPQGLFLSKVFYPKKYLVESPELSGSIPEMVP